MIGVTFAGRMGNQMLEYALARKLMHMRGDRDQLIFNFHHVEACGNQDEGFEDSLRYYQVQPYSYNTHNLVLQYGSFSQRISYLRYIAESHSSLGKKKGISDYARQLQKHGVYFNFRLPLSEVHRAKNIFTIGICEHPECFDDIVDILREEFTPKAPLMEYNQDLFRHIQDSNSVCVQVRRGDYLSSQNSGMYNVCGKEYFERAISEMKKQLDHPAFFFFSDDVAWAHEAFGTMENTFFQSERDTAWETMRLMNECKHFIISNSTFAWWGQYLSRNEDKLVVAPVRWFVNGGENYPLLQPNFIRL